MAASHEELCRMHEDRARGNFPRWLADWASDWYRRMKSGKNYTGDTDYVNMCIYDWAVHTLKEFDNAA